MDQLAALIDFVPLPGFTLGLFAAALTGEAGIIALMVLAAQGALPAAAVIAGSALGTFLADAAWFLVGHTYLGRAIERREHLARHAQRVNAFLSGITRDVHLRTLIAAKFLLGTRILTILHLSRTGLSLRAFLRYNVAATAIWLTVIAAAGWLMGRGVASIAPALDAAQALATALLIALIAFSLIKVWLTKRLAGRRRR